MLTKKFVKRSFTFKFYVKVWSCNRPLILWGCKPNKRRCHFHVSWFNSYDYHIIFRITGCHLRTRQKCMKNPLNHLTFELASLFWLAYQIPKPNFIWKETFSYVKISIITAIIQILEAYTVASLLHFITYG